MSRMNGKCNWCGRKIDVNTSLGMSMFAGNTIYCSKKCESEAAKAGQKKGTFHLFFLGFIIILILIAVCSK